MSDGLKPYSAMKDSGVPWLGRIPEHWQIRPVFAAYSPKLVKNTGLIEKTVLSLSYGQIVVKPEEKLHGLVPESFETYQVIAPGDIIVRTTDLQNDQTSLRVGISRHHGIITSAYLCLATRELFSPEYGYLVLDAYDLLKILYGYGSGLRQNLDFADIKRMPVPVPPPDEQVAIVRFLDYADQRIRTYIRAKQKLMRLLEERKRAIIQRVVTHGIDSHIQHGRSEVEWLGAVPKHWTVKRLKYLFREKDERSRTGVEVLLSLRMRHGLLPHNHVSKIPIGPNDLIGFKKVSPGQLVMNRMRAAIGMFGIAPQEGLVSPDYAVFDPIGQLNPEYFLYLFKTKAAMAIFRIESKGLGTGSSGFMRLYTDRFGLIKVAIPPIEEQNAIVQNIARLTVALDGRINQIEREVNLIREYRLSLIAGVVTGGLDVREASKGLPDTIDEPMEEEAEDAEEIEADDPNNQQSAQEAEA